MYIWGRSMNLCTYEAVLLGFFLIFLLLSAIFDSHGASVPDAASLPVAVLGLCFSLFRYEFYISSVSFFLLIAFLFLPVPGVFSAWNEKIVERSYGNDENLRHETETLDLAAAKFEEKWGDTLYSMLQVLYVFLAILLFLFYIEMKALQYLFPLLIWILLLVWTSYSNSQDNTDIEPLSAMGGADIIVGIGFFALYGPIKFLCALILTLSAFILHYYGMRRIKKTYHQTGEPLLPVVFLMTPICAFLLLSVAPARVPM